MSLTSEQVKELRDFAKNFWPIHPGDYEVREKMKKAVDSIEALSIKLQEYEDLGVTPEQLRQIDGMYADRCKEIVELKKKLKDALETAM